MDLTIEELKVRIINQFDADLFLELLDIGIEELVEAFTDKVEEYYDTLIQEVEE